MTVLYLSRFILAFNRLTDTYRDSRIVFCYPGLYLAFVVPAFFSSTNSGQLRFSRVLSLLVKLPPRLRDLSRPSIGRNVAGLWPLTFLDVRSLSVRLGNAILPLEEVDVVQRRGRRGNTQEFRRPFFVCGVFDSKFIKSLSLSLSLSLSEKRRCIPNPKIGYRGPHS